MGYKSLISSNVTKAFNLVKDLADDVILNKRSNEAFDFSTGTTSSKSTSIIIKAIVTDITKPSPDRKTTKKSMMLNTKETGELSLYDSVTISGSEWKIGSPISSTGFITNVEIYKEL